MIAGANVLTQTSARTPRSPSQVVTAADGDAAVIASVRRVLTKVRLPRNERCTCADCRAVASVPFHCEQCGYGGRPATMPCDCLSVAQRAIRTMSYLVAMGDEYRGQTPIETVRSELADMRRLIPTLGRCRGHGAGHVGWPVLEDCCHTTARCPACTGYADGGGVDGSDHLLAILREINAAVGTAGIIPQR